MNIWTSSRAALALGGALALAGCIGATTTAREIGPVPEVQRVVGIADTGILIGGPAGYCVDLDASRLADDVAFVLLGGCASIAQDLRVGSPKVPAVLTALVDRTPHQGGETGDPLDEMQRFIVSAEGKAALARDGDGTAVDILETYRDPDALYVFVWDESDSTPRGLERTYWRGFFELRGRVVTVSLMNFRKNPMGVEDGLATLKRFIGAIRAQTDAAVSST